MISISRWKTTVEPRLPGAGADAFYVPSPGSRAPDGSRDPARAHAGGPYQRRYVRYGSVFASLLKSGQRLGWVRKAILADQLDAKGDGWMILAPIEPDRFEPKPVNAHLDATMAIISIA